MPCLLELFEGRGKRQGMPCLYGSNNPKSDHRSQRTKSIFHEILSFCKIHFVDLINQKPTLFFPKTKLLFQNFQRKTIRILPIDFPC
jgi:hypothetical protein